MQAYRRCIGLRLLTSLLGGHAWRCSEITLDSAGWTILVMQGLPSCTLASTLRPGFKLSLLTSVEHSRVVMGCLPRPRIGGRVWTGSR